jgi:hypothetical protein
MLYPLSYEGGHADPSWWWERALLTTRPSGPSSAGAFRDSSGQPGREEQPLVRLSGPPRMPTAAPKCQSPRARAPNSAQPTSRRLGAALDALAVSGEQGEAALTSGPAPLSAAGWRVQTGHVLPGVAGGTTA